MNQALFMGAMLTWVLYIPIVFLNATIREVGYKPFVGDLAAHQISSVTASAAFFSFAYFMMRSKIASASMQHLIFIGISWVILTVGFEFGFGHYIAKAPWQQLAADYNVLKGRIWPLLLVVIGVTPVVLKFLESRK